MLPINKHYLISKELHHQIAQTVTATQKICYTNALVVSTAEIYGLICKIVLDEKLNCWYWYVMKMFAVYLNFIESVSVNRRSISFLKFNLENDIFILTFESK
jgi:hypothetical protein